MHQEDTTPTAQALQRVTLGGEAHTLMLPEFIVRDELLAAWGEATGKPVMRQLRVACALLGCCTRLGKRSGKTYAETGYDALAYGGHVYGYLRGVGVAQADMMTAGLEVLAFIAQHLAPRESEVAEREGFSGGGGAESTAPPSG